MHFYFVLFGLISVASLSSSRILSFNHNDKLNSNDIDMQLNNRKKMNQNSPDYKKRVSIFMKSKVSTALSEGQSHRVIVDEGSSFTLRCNIIGSPRAAIKWFADEQRNKEIRPIETKNNEMSDEEKKAEDTPYEFVIINSTYTIECASREHSGRFTCEGEANGLTSYQTIDVVVMPKPIEERSCFLPSEPIITEFISTIFSLLHHDLTLPCKIQTNKQTRIAWETSNGQIIDEWNAQNSDDYKVLSDGSLNIRELQWEDMGEWTCIISMEDEKMTASTFVYPYSGH